MTLSHEQARQYLRITADGTLEARQQVELDQHLADCSECQAYAHELARLDARLSRALQVRWPYRTPTEADRINTLELIRSQNRNSQRKNSASNDLRTLAWAGLTVFLVILLTWSIRNLVPRPATKNLINSTSTGLAPTTEVGLVLPEITPVATLEVPTPEPVSS